MSSEHQNTSNYFCKCGNTGSVRFNMCDEFCGIMCSDCWKNYKEREIINKEETKERVYKNPYLLRKLKEIYKQLEDCESYLSMTYTANLPHNKALIRNCIQKSRKILDTILE